MDVDAHQAFQRLHLALERDGLINADGAAGAAAELAIEHQDLEPAGPVQHGLEVDDAFEDALAAPEPEFPIQAADPVQATNAAGPADRAGSLAQMDAVGPAAVGPAREVPVNQIVPPESDSDDDISWDDSENRENTPSNAAPAQKRRKTQQSRRRRSSAPAKRRAIPDWGCQGPACSITDPAGAVAHIEAIQQSLLGNVGAQSADDHEDRCNLCSECTVSLICKFKDDHVLAAGLELFEKLDAISEKAAKAAIRVFIGLLPDVDDEMRINLLKFMAPLTTRGPMKPVFAIEPKKGAEDAKTYPISMIVAVLDDFLEKRNNLGVITALQVLDGAVTSKHGGSNFAACDANFDTVLRSLGLEDEGLEIRYRVAAIISATSLRSVVAKGHWVEHTRKTADILLDLWERGVEHNHRDLVLTVLELFGTGSFLGYLEKNNKLPTGYEDRLTATIAATETKSLNETQRDQVDVVKEFLGLESHRQLEAKRKQKARDEALEKKRKREEERRMAEEAAEVFEGDLPALRRLFYSPLAEWYPAKRLGRPKIDVTKYYTEAKIVDKHRDGVRWWCRYASFFDVGAVLNPKDEEGDEMKGMPKGNDYPETLPKPGMHWQLPADCVLVDTEPMARAIEKEAWPDVAAKREAKEAARRAGTKRRIGELQKD